MHSLLVSLFLNFRTSLDGVLLAVVAWLMSQGVTLSAENTSRLVGIGALIAGAIWKFFSKDPVPQPEPPSGGGPSSWISRLYLIPFLMLATLPLMAVTCNKTPDAAQRTIVAGTYDAQLAIEAGGKTSLAFNTRGRLSLPKHKLASIKLKGISTAFDKFGREIEQWPVIEAGNKQQILDAATRLITQVQIIAEDGELIVIDGETQSQIRRAVFVAVAIANGIKLAIASAPTGTPLAKVQLPEETARTVANRSAKGFTDQDAALTQDLITIWTDFLVKVKSQRGQPLGTLREWSLKAYESNQAFFAAQLAR